MNTTTSARSISILHYPQRGRDGLSCWIAQPERLNPALPPLVAIHGLHRGARAQANLLATEAIATGRTVIAPLFSEERWPRFQQVVRRDRADLALISLLADLRLAGLCEGATIDLAGYSAGAQFAHRFAMLYPHLISRLHVTAAGWYTFPDSAPFPYGIGPGDAPRESWAGRLNSGLDAFAALPIRVHVGVRDTIVDEHTRSGPEIDAQQGRSRLDRARNWVAAIKAQAEARGIQPDISLNVIDGCGHDFTSCVRIGGLDRLLCAPA
ncbi:MAG: hypothetical protein AAFV19_14995 [Pseudomonadota bacterium]